jgi:hypothetical protein
MNQFPPDAEMETTEKKLTGEKPLDTDITIPLFSDVYLKIGPVAKNGKVYPTSRLQKGFLLFYKDQELAEEGVGFGVPLLKLGVKTIFPGAIELTHLNRDQHQEIIATYRMNLEERLMKQGLQSVNSSSLYRIKNRLADAYRRYPTLRGPLTALSNTLRRSFGWQTTFEETGFNQSVKIKYTVDRQAGNLEVDFETGDIHKSGVTEVVVMNEQGAHHFDTYTDSSGEFLRGEAIGNWNEVRAEQASFIDRAHQLAFTLQRIDGVSLFRGRELIGSRLAWSGFGYSFLPTRQRFTHTVRIERIP